MSKTTNKFAPELGIAATSAMVRSGGFTHAVFWAGEQQGAYAGLLAGDPRSA